MRLRSRRTASVHVWRGEASFEVPISAFNIVNVDLATMSSRSRRTVAPYGTWVSPITAEFLTLGSISFGEIAVVWPSAADQPPRLVYVENRAAEKGRAALITTTLPFRDSHVELKNSQDITDGKLNVRSAVHEYGGGALAVSQLGHGSVVFSSYKPRDHAVYRICFGPNAAEEPERITPQCPALRFADFCPHPHNPDLILAVQEDHTVDEPSGVVNTLVIIDAHKKSVDIIAEGRDFYASPRWSSDGQLIAWINWDHPEMPFWATELCVAAFDQQRRVLNSTQSISGREGGAITQNPIWLPDRQVNTLVFSSDSENGFSLPQLVEIQQDASGVVNVGNVTPVLRAEMKADFIKPAWTLNNSTMVALSRDILACALTRGSEDSLAIVRLATGEVLELDTPYRSFTQLRRAADDKLVVHVASACQAAAIAIFDLKDALTKNSTQMSAQQITVIRHSSDLLSSGTLSPDYLSQPAHISFPTTIPPSGEPALAHAILYKPQNPHYSAPKGSTPPCILKIHGGPTSAAAAGQLSWETNFWTSRGYSICYVNYGGSTGYGRDYMLRLNEKWGLVDVQDCVAAAKFLSTSTSQEHTTKAPRKETPEQMTQTAQEQWENMQEVYDPVNSTASVTLSRARGNWGWLDAVTTPLVVAASIALGKLVATGSVPCPVAGLMGTHPTMTTASVTFAALVGYMRLFKVVVTSETVMASSNFGLQVETCRGIYLPWCRRPSAIVSVERTLVPRDRILDVLLSTSVRGWTIRDYLAVGIRSVPDDSVKAGRPNDAPITRSLQVLFPNLQPRLPVIQQIYQVIYPALFPSSSNPLANTRTPVPELRKARTGNEAVDASGVPLADPNKIIISGDSAGGYTVLACLTNYPDVFNSATSKYGIADLNLLAAESHKFESRYLLKLLSGTSEEVPQVYKDRSPIWKAERIKTPLLVAQGSEDRVVPPNQSEMIVKAIQNQPDGESRVKYLLFAGEGHGFRQKENVITMITEEEAWYRKTLKLGH